MSNVAETDGGFTGDGVTVVNHPAASSICPIDHKSVHRICSGQVVLTLSTAVKELLENSIDAGATIIDIRLKDYGSVLIEVSDNGAGVEEPNFQALTLKHHTSKLQEFTDLVSVETFGFRGEALSSLCALSELTITTRHKSAAVGTRLEFDTNGKIIKQSPQARQVGTTVTLQNLFYTLPVRHKEFTRNVRREFVKMVHVLNAYCIISTRVRITCTNITAKGSKSEVVSSKGNTTVQENIANVFGPKQMSSVLKFMQISPTDDVCTEFGLKPSNTDMFRVEGHISKCVHGQGRSSSDRQFFFINGRPFDSSKLSKVVNEVYHQYNRHQFPFVVLTINMQKDNVDVNVTPDKRQVFLEGEKRILATVKASLIAMYEPTTSVLQMQSPASIQPGIRDKIAPAEGKTVLSRHPSLDKVQGESSLMKLKRSFSSAFSREDIPSPSNKPASRPARKQRRLDSFVSFYSPSRQASQGGRCLNDVSATHGESCGGKSAVDTSHGGPLDVGQPLHGGNMSAVDMEKSGRTTKINSESDKCSDTNRTWSVVTDIVETELSTGCDDRNTAGVYSGDTALTAPGLISGDSLHTHSGHNSNTEERAGVTHHCVGFNIELHAHDSTRSKDALSQESTGSDVEHVKESSEGRTRALSKYTIELHDGTGSASRETREESRSQSNPGGSVYHTSNEDSHGAPCLSDSDPPSVQTGVYDTSNVDSDGVPYHSDSDPQSVQTAVYGTSNVDSDGVPCLSDRDPQSVQTGSFNTAPLQDTDQTDDVWHDVDIEESLEKKERSVQFSLETLKQTWSTRKGDTKCGGFSRVFRATINPGENTAAEQELQREIKKEMFSRMEILGQFNLGFIIARLEQDLFIVDQHATDEKFNFENLQRDHVIQSQKLICPLGLDLTASNETILLDNLEIFRKNGFEFSIDEQGPPTQRVKLASTPVSKNWNFGKEDIEEMIFMLSESPGVTCRPSRVRAMFASRACRKSVMIGTYLNKAQMRKLVCHMGEIEQPWNCPHGRPTMRHLINLNMVPR